MKPATTQAKSQTQLLRELINQEVRKAIKEEMVPILLEIIKASTHTPAAPAPSRISEVAPPVNNYVGSLKPVNGYKQNPLDRQTAAPAAQQAVAADPGMELLEQTRREMLAKANLGDMSEFKALMSGASTGLNLVEDQTYPQPFITEQEQPAAPSVDRMLQTATKASKEEYVEINDVPDFSNMMKKILE